jgi:hypothetical protein
VDLGTMASGRVVAAYSRCGRDPVGGVAATGRGCDLYAYDLYTHRERRLSRPSTSAASECMPSLANGRVAFGRVSGGRTAVYVGRLAGGSLRRVRGGTTSRDRRTGLTGLDLAEDHLAISWRAFGPTGQALPCGAAELRVDDLQRGTKTLVVRLANTNLDTGSVFSPSLEGRWVRYGLTWVSEGDTVLSERDTCDFKQGFRTSLPLPDRLAGVAEPGTGESYFVTCERDGPCRVVLTGQLPLGPDADAALAVLARPTPLSWNRAWAAYSEYDASLPGYRLALRSVKGKVLDPDVPSRAVPFDADVGRGPGGDLAVVYSRCRVEPRTDAIDRLPIPASGRGCDVYRYDVHSARERWLALAAQGGRSEFLPAPAGFRVVFGVRSARGATALYAGNLNTGRTRKLTGNLGALGPRSLDLRDRRLAVAWDDRLRDGRLRSRVRLFELGGHARTLASVRSRHGARRCRSLGFDGNVLTWVGHHLAGLGPRVAVRHDLAHRTRRILVLPDGAAAYVPWTIERGVPLSHVGAYGWIGVGGWSLRTPLMLPELLR